MVRAGLSFRSTMELAANRDKFNFLFVMSCSIVHTNAKKHSFALAWLVHPILQLEPDCIASTSGLRICCSDVSVVRFE